MSPIRYSMKAYIVSRRPHTTSFHCPLRQGLMGCSVDNISGKTESPLISPLFPLLLRSFYEKASGLPQD